MSALGSRWRKGGNGGFVSGSHRSMTVHYRRVMRKVTLGSIVLLFPLAALAAGKGVVVKAHVCDTGNVIVETTDRWYVAAEYHSGVSLEQGDIVFGKLKAYGVNAISREDGEQMHPDPLPDRVVPTGERGWREVPDCS